MPNYVSKVMMDTPSGIIFAFFLLGIAGLTGTTIAWLRNSPRLDRIALGVVLASIIASWVVGFNAEELVLVCLPLIMGCSIFCSCVFIGRKAQRKECKTVHWSSEV
jgi:hypothetical protein